MMALLYHIRRRGAFRIVFRFCLWQNNSAVNIVEHMPLWYGQASFVFSPKKLLPNFLKKNHRTRIQNSCDNLHFQQQWKRFFFTLHSLQHKLSTVFSILAILTGIRWNLRVLICISLMVKDVMFEHFKNIFQSF